MGVVLVWVGVRCNFARWGWEGGSEFGGSEVLSFWGERARNEVRRGQEIFLWDGGAPRF